MIFCTSPHLKSRNESTLVYTSVSEGDLVGQLVKCTTARCPNDYDGVGHGDAEAGAARIQYVSTTGVQDLFLTALLVCIDVMAVENTMSWPPTIDDFDDEDIKLVPSSLYNPLAWIIDGDTRNDIPEDLGRRVCIKNGRVHR